MSQYSTLKIERIEDTNGQVVVVSFNRPKAKNAMNHQFWSDVKSAFEELSLDNECRCIVLAGEGSCFTAGLDLKYAMDVLMPPESADTGRQALALRSFVQFLQSVFVAVESCSKPVIAAVHGPCIGAGVEVILACDIRLCSKDAFFALKEIDIGLAADLGGLQRLPRTVANQSWCREVVYTGRKVNAEEALRVGLVGEVLDTKEAVMARALALARQIASKSPVAVTGAKFAMNYSRDHTVQEGLEMQNIWNMAALQSEDLAFSVMAALNPSGGAPQFQSMYSPLHLAYERKQKQTQKQQSKL